MQDCNSPARFLLSRSEPRLRGPSSFLAAAMSCPRGDRRPTSLTAMSKVLGDSHVHIPMRKKAQKDAPTRDGLEPFQPLFLRLKTQPCLCQRVVKVGATSSTNLQMTSPFSDIRRHHFIDTEQDAADQGRLSALRWLVVKQRLKSVLIHL